MPTDSGGGNAHRKGHSAHVLFAVVYGCRSYAGCTEQVLCCGTPSRASPLFCTNLELSWELVVLDFWLPLLAVLVIDVHLCTYLPDVHWRAKSAQRALHRSVGADVLRILCFFLGVSSLTVDLRPKS